MKQTITYLVGGVLVMILLSGCGQDPTASKTTALNQRVNQDNTTKTTATGKKEMKRIKDQYHSANYEEAYQLINEMVTSRSDDLSAEDHNKLMSLFNQVSYLAQVVEDMAISKENNDLVWESRVFANLDKVSQQEGGDSYLVAQAELLESEADDLFESIATDIGLDRTVNR